MMIHATVAVLVVAGLIVSTWYWSHARAESRWRAALDRYAEHELGKATHTLKGHQR
jgi:hypothetical protein